MRTKYYKILIFISSFLLFSVQPMIGKFILPWFGGSASVWITALLFFQTVLLLGYLYAYLISRFKIIWQIVAYLLPIILAVIFLPVTPDNGGIVGVGGDPTFYILLILLSSIGLSYFILSATSPLLQAWASSDKQSSPYKLYAWSNAGSLLGLFSYPILIEPFFSSQQQTYIWSALFVVFSLGAIYLAFKLRKISLEHSDDESEKELKSSKFSHKLAWVMLPFATTLLLMATTNYITQDVASVPFLWVLPLGLYLLSFIITFSDKVVYDRGFLGWMFLVFTAMGAFSIVWGIDMPLVLVLIISLLLFFIYCIICHGELYALRPEANQLTKFYLWLSLGGALGGFFVAVVAPIIFSLYLEYPLGLSVTFLAIIILWTRKKLWLPWPEKRSRSLIVIALFVIFVLGNITWGIWMNFSGPSYLDRDFFGVIRILKSERVALLYHGRILHGAQYLDEDKKCQPITYYTDNSGFSRTAEFLESNDDDFRVGVVGLGVGTAAIYGDYSRLYELNPEISRIAEEDFKYLSDCSKEYDIVNGDARLSLEREEGQNFDLLMLDAFNGDSIPVHLLTQEAFELYLRHLADDGVIVVHISNKHINLEPVMAGIMKKLSLAGMVIRDEKSDNPLIVSGKWAVFSKKQETVDKIRMEVCDDQCVSDFDRAVLWTDNYSDLFSVLDITDRTIKFFSEKF